MSLFVNEYMEKLYLSISCMTQFKALESLKYQYVLISFSTKFNKKVPYWTNNVFIDSGGYGIILQYGRYTSSDEEYLKFIEVNRPKYFALRDYACDKRVLKKWNRTSKQHIDMTVDHHLRMLDLIDKFNIDSQPVPVLQGSNLYDILECLDLFKEYNLLKYDLIALTGTIAKDLSISEAENVIVTLRKEIPRKNKLHLFGIKLNLIKNFAIYKSIYSADTSNWDYISRWKIMNKYNNIGAKYECSVMCAKEYIKKYNEIKSKFDKIKTVYEILEFLKRKNKGNSLKNLNVENKQLNDNMDG